MGKLDKLKSKIPQGSQELSTGFGICAQIHSDRLTWVAGSSQPAATASILDTVRPALGGGLLDRPARFCRRRASIIFCK